MARVVDFAVALAKAEDALAKRESSPASCLVEVFRLDQARDDLGRKLSPAEEAEFHRVSRELWQATAGSQMAELERAISIGVDEHNTVRRILKGSLVSLKDGVDAARVDWITFLDEHGEAIARGSALLDRFDRARRDEQNLPSEPPVDLGAAFAAARRLLDEPETDPHAWLRGLSQLAKVRFASTRPLDASEQAEFRELAHRLWQAAADSLMRRLRRGLDTDDLEEVETILVMEILSLKNQVAWAGLDWHRFLAEHQALIDLGNARLAAEDD